MPVEIIGGLAGILCTISFLPQVIKMFRSKNTRDISLLMFVILSVGVFLWLVYGILRKDMPVVISNAAIFILALSIVLMKLRYK